MVFQDPMTALDPLFTVEQQIVETDTTGLALVQEPVDLTRCRLTLVRGTPAGTTRKVRIDYWLVSESGPPSGMPVKTAAVREAKVESYNQAGAIKRLYPLVRTVSTIDEAGVAPRWFVRRRVRLP